MDFSHLANKYLTFVEKRLASQVLKYKKLVYSEFIKHHGNLPINEITPDMVDQYLSTRHTNNNYNMHRKDLSTLFAYAKNTLKMEISNPCSELPKLPHTPVKKTNADWKRNINDDRSSNSGRRKWYFNDLYPCSWTYWWSIAIDLGRMWILTNDQSPYGQENVKNGEYESDAFTNEWRLIPYLKKSLGNNKIQSKWVFLQRRYTEQIFSSPQDDEVDLPARRNSTYWQRNEKSWKRKTQRWKEKNLTYIMDFTLWDILWPHIVRYGEGFSEKNFRFIAS